MSDQLNILESFDNPNINKDYLIKIKVPEFTCLCPKTGQPDFAIVYIRYIPKDLCVELKSLKLYMASYRNIGAFHEAITNIKAPSKKLKGKIVDTVEKGYLLGEKVIRYAKVVVGN